MYTDLEDPSIVLSRIILRKEHGGEFLGVLMSITEKFLGVLMSVFSASLPQISTIPNSHIGLLTPTHISPTISIADFLSMQSLLPPGPFPGPGFY